MILKGNQRAYGGELARHLLNVMDNEHVYLHELHGFIADDLAGAFREVEAVSIGTKCQQYLFSLSLNPPADVNVSVSEFEAAIAEIEKRLGLAGQPRAIVFHEKLGRRHCHCAWSRIDVGQMRAISLPHYKRRLMDISRELYLEHGWDMPAGLRNHDERNPLNYSGAEASQGKRTKRDPAKLKETFKACWAVSDSRAAFATALWEAGFCLARGDRRGFVAVDADGEFYSLSRWCGVKAKELRTRCGDGADLPSVDEAVSLLRRNADPSHDQADDRQRQKRERAQATIDAKEAELVTRQRAERDDLQKAQETQRLAEIKARQAKLPRGVRAVWAKLSGQYARLAAEFERDAKASEARDKTETQKLIDCHLAERRELERERLLFKAQTEFEDELHEAAQSPKRRIYQPDPRQPLILPHEIPPFSVEELKRQPDLILGYISDKEASFSRNDVVRGLAKFIDDPLDLRAAIDAAMASPELVALDEDDVFTTRDYLTSETQLLARAAEMAKMGGFSVDERNVDRAIESENTKLQRRVGATLSDEQIAAIKHAVRPNQLSSIIGLAGAGKSTLLSVARAAWEKQSYHVYGAALAGKAADGLQAASGITSRTLASLEASWKNGYEPIDAGGILVIDEAGMVGTRQLDRISKQLEKRGCKLVLVGDPEQLQPIEAGTPFRSITDQNGVARLTEIRRQREEWQRQASRELATGRVQEALKRYADHGAVHEANTCNEAIAALVDAYMADFVKHGETASRVALAHRRKDVYAINQAIKAAKTEAGEYLGAIFQTDHGPRAFAAGDRILFTRNDAKLGVRNGMLGSLASIDGRNFTVCFDADEMNAKRKLTFSPDRVPSIDHGFAVSIHRSQGCTVDRSFVLSDRATNANLSYVAMTRHRLRGAIFSSGTGGVSALATEIRKNTQSSGILPQQQRSNPR